MRTERGDVFAIHNAASATKEFQMFIKIWSDWNQNSLSEWENCHPSAVMDRHGYTQPGSREHEGSDPWGLNPGHSTLGFKHPPSAPARKALPWTHQGTASLPSPAWLWPAGSCIREIGGNKSYELRNMQCSCLCTHIPPLASKLSSITPSVGWRWVQGYITHPALNLCSCHCEHSAELSGICFLAWIIVRELLVQ